MTWPSEIIKVMHGRDVWGPIGIVRSLNQDPIHEVVSPFIDDYDKVKLAFIPSVHPCIQSMHSLHFCRKLNIPSSIQQHFHLPENDLQKPDIDRIMAYNLSKCKRQYRVLLGG